MSLWLAMGLGVLRRLQQQSGRFCRTVRNQDGSGRGIGGLSCSAPGPRWWIQPDALQKLFRSRLDHSPSPGPLASGCWSRLFPGAPDFCLLLISALPSTLFRLPSSAGTPHPVTHPGSHWLLPQFLTKGCRVRSHESCRF